MVPKTSGRMMNVLHISSTLKRMAEVSVRMLNQETSKVLARVKRGEEIVLTDRGEVFARIVPASANQLNALISAGRVQPATTGGRAPRPTVPMRGSLDAGKLLEKMRAAERY